jgi:ABC-type dipeptide/oligopeptide/nickel transport system permease subunit
LNNKNALGHNKFFDLKMGLISGLAMGTIVFFINWDYGLLAGLVAALKQGVYTFLAGGIMMRMTENIASRFSTDIVAILLAVLIPTTIAITLTYILHSLKGTPEPLNSTIPTIILAPFGFLWWALKKRKQMKSIARPDL